MKKKSAVIALSLLLGLPSLGFAETATTQTNQVAQSRGRRFQNQVTTSAPATRQNGLGRKQNQVSTATQATRQNGLGRNQNQSRFVDENKDGICDLYGTKAQNLNFVDANGDGVCDNLNTEGRGMNRNNNATQSKGRRR